MPMFAGLDVGGKRTAVWVMDDAGKIAFGASVIGAHANVLGYLLSCRRRDSNSNRPECIQQIVRDIGFSDESKFLLISKLITKELDKATPLLYNALVNNENISEWQLQFWRPQGAAMTPPRRRTRSPGTRRSRRGCAHRRHLPPLRVAMGWC